MLRFAVYDETGPADRWLLKGAHLVSRDDLPTEGTVSFERGMVVCQKRGNRSAGLCLLHDAGSAGRLMLQTCLLPDREKPYLLSVELARHRIKMFIAKSEEWQMFDLSDGHPAMKLWEEARVLLTSALTEVDPLKADRAARRSLECGIEATERLALAHAEILLHRRFAARRASSSTLGVRIAPAMNSAGLRELIARDFDVVVIPLRWRDLEVEEGRYNWEPVDRWMQWAKSQNKPIVAGPLLDFSKEAMPDWMYVWQHDYDTCRDLAYDHIERVVQRYAAAVGIWNLAAGMNVNDNFRFTPEQMIDLVRMAALLVRQVRKGARAMIELRQPFGEHSAKNADSVAPIAFIERLVQEGIRLDAVGVQLLFGSAGAGRETRDLMQVSSLLDRFFLLEIPVIVSAMGVPSEPGDPEGGWWREPWTPETQGLWLARVFAMGMSKPFVESMFWHDLVDSPGGGTPGMGLITVEGRGKQSLSRLVGARKRLRKPLGPLKLPSKAPDPPVPPVEA